MPSRHLAFALHPSHPFVSQRGLPSTSGWEAAGQLDRSLCSSLLKSDFHSLWYILFRNTFSKPASSGMFTRQHARNELMDKTQPGIAVRQQNDPYLSCRASHDERPCPVHLAPLEKRAGSGFQSPAQSPANAWFGRIRLTLQSHDLPPRNHHRRHQPFLPGLLLQSGTAQDSRDKGPIVTCSGFQRVRGVGCGCPMGIDAFTLLVRNGLIRRECIPPFEARRMHA